MKKNIKAYVPHPRFGNKPMNNAGVHSDEKVKQSYWQYSYEKFFRQSAIVADISKQNHSGYPRKLYVDIEKRCITCSRDFIFFAKEQQYWYEVLGFYIDLDCIKCIECRKAEHKIKEKALRYEELIKKKNRTNRELKDLKYVAYDLYEIGYLKNKSKLAQILKLKEM